jgi:hypothetical protein
MTDFFTRLAERTLAVAPSVQPSLAPLFAPGPTLAPDGRHALQGTAWTETSPETSDRASGADSAAQPPGLSRAGATPPSRQATDAPVSEPAPPLSRENAARGGRHPLFIDAGLWQPTHSLAAEADADLAEQRLFSPLLPPNPLPRSAPDHSGEQQVRTDSRHAGARTDSDAKTPVRSLLELAVEETDSDGVGEPARTERRATPEGPPELSQGRRPPIAVTVLPQRIPVQPTAGEASEAPTVSPPTAPIIRVNIGRIEVRAVMPSPQATARPAPSRPASTLSLEDYLKQRREGRR